MTMPMMMAIIMILSKIVDKPSTALCYAQDYEARGALRVYRLELPQFPSGKEFFRQGIYRNSAIVVHANYMKGQDVKRGKLKEALLWRDGLVPGSPGSPAAEADAAASAAAVDGVTSSVLRAIRNESLALSRPVTSIEDLRDLHSPDSPLSWNQVERILQDVHESLKTCEHANDCGLLLFGGTQDMALWERATPPGCPILFVEDNVLVASWAQERAASWRLGVQVMHVEFQGSFREWKQRLRDREWLKIGMPHQIRKHMWDVIVVAGPYAGGPGRMKSIFWSWMAASPDGSVFVSDLRRPGRVPQVEETYAYAYFGEPDEVIHGDDHPDGRQGNVLGRFVLP